MEYVYAALILNESDEEVNEENITAVLEAAGVDVEESRVKALVAALEDVDIEEAIETAAAAPAPAAGGSAGGEVEAADDDDEEDAEEEAADEGGDDDDDDEEADGEGLGALFG
ncbi:MULTISPECIES: 50S ribosomal protein P1 [Haloferax]|uniref:Large ribosomal subunit protein P1 n=5 Tax=Haloferax TaxID=2251 RepID=A0A871BG24_HALGI|nr:MULTISPECIES: 50S ribosomal protein P1 [Haloferax]ELZ66832.1 50S ribosomal protein L12P [Haloferax prahovense DSM 18310]ELZ81106.1 50S ribosomal protein L12P [Haloferax gibbonsii ATCC 33959]MDS0241174.1 50S ribosomal protein P1 [Haloferax sp. S2CR25]MDS0444295.1 50S ribosomal protein P1 [Haloferax sp. S2CR25-2]POG56460.1 50S ribosomal protein P1 [Haloferax marisrubri]